jgi:hypothetical protein
VGGWKTLELIWNLMEISGFCGGCGGSKRSDNRSATSKSILILKPRENYHPLQRSSNQLQVKGIGFSYRNPAITPRCFSEQKQLPSLSFDGFECCFDGLNKY